MSALGMTVEKVGSLRLNILQVSGVKEGDLMTPKAHWPSMLQLMTDPIFKSGRSPGVEV